MSLTPALPELSSDLHSRKFNVVIVPTSGLGKGDQTFILSAMRRDRGLRLVSPDWTEVEVRRALAAAGCTTLQVEHLLHGNRMAYGGRRTDYLYFTEEQLLEVGLQPEKRPAEPEPDDAEVDADLSQEPAEL